MFNTIVVPLDLDGNEGVVLSVAGAVAGKTGAAVRLVTVASPGLDHMDDEVRLATLAKSVEASAVRTEVIESNHVAEALIAATVPTGVLCLDTRARGPLASIVMGSVAREVLRATPDPVLLIGPATRPDPPLTVIEVCVDLADTAAALVPVAADWSRALGSSVRVVHATAAADHSTTVGARELVATVAARIAEASGAAVQAHVLSGHPRDAIVEDAEGVGASIVMVGVRPRHGPGRAALGSVAVGVAHHVTGAVLAVPCERPRTGH